MDKVSQIISVSLCFAVPVVAGYYLDQWLETGFVFTVVSLFFGMAAAAVQFRKLLRSLERDAKLASEKFKSTK
ncbi:Putative F0F1-ATPase subunit (ATPase_gene1) [Mariniblastus fucicola]|uniref:F0F1-ATPase subunit (ATPase_gene1) n=2 Tax=Mariniblastus fucicola TaxID=980251 RepID=A0A5B9PPH7_9BACT|nr:Putative F0F1-ATPase subunit (ATPase_gene1) [Mariniblastus fucicola]